MRKALMLVSGLALAALFLSCTWDGDPKKNTGFSLRGVWESTNKSEYPGILVIGSDTIIITGYTKKPAETNDHRRPFNTLGREAPLDCHTEDGKLFIKGTGEPQGFPYTLSSKPDGKYLLFNFDGREEYLKLCETTDTNIQGTWLSYDDNEEISGTLVIDSKSIKITGYTKGQSPFRDLSKNYALDCCTAGGKLFITGGSKVKRFAYQRGSGSLIQYLTFEFEDGSEERLKMKSY